MLKFSTYLIILVPTSFLHAQVASTELKSKGIITITPSEIMANPQSLTDLWTTEPIPLTYYNSAELAMQKEINNEAADAIVTFSPSNQKQEWNAYDSLEITPYTWKWIDLEMPQHDGSITYMSLRRPNAWILEKNALPGNKVYFDWEEVGSAGWASVTRIRPNQLDTRLWNERSHDGFSNKPIIGKFEHTSDNVYDLFFDHEAPMGVTDTHPIWSIDRNAWVAASKLNIGERVNTVAGTSSLLRRERRPGTHTVYNIEVYKSHNYFASASTVLVHNGPICFDIARWKGLIDQARMNLTPRILANIYKVRYSTRTVGEVMEIAVYDIFRKEGVEKSPGQFSKLISELTDEARASGAKKVEILFFSTSPESLQTYFEKGIFERFLGITVKRVETGDHPSYHIEGKLNNIRELGP